MTIYLLDTNHISPLVTLGHPLRRRVLRQSRLGDSFGIPLPALTELLYGIQMTPRASANLAQWHILEDGFTYYGIDRQDAELAADLQIALRRRGRQMATVDALIATIALRYDLPLLGSVDIYSAPSGA